MPFYPEFATSTPLGRGQWRLEVRLVYRGAWEAFVIPKGFIHDFASVPRALWPLVGPVDDHAEEAVLHDWLYQTGLVSRADADGLFRRALREAGVGRARRWAMYWAVRACGGVAWRRARACEALRKSA